MYYFAYGSNLSKKQMTKRCPDSKPISVASLTDHKVIFTGYSIKWDGGVATVIPSQGDTAMGAIYDVSQVDLDSLDKSEGYHNKVYDRKIFHLTDSMGNILDAIAYYKLGQMIETTPSKQYLTVIQEGYRDWGIDSWIKGCRYSGHHCDD